MEGRSKACEACHCRKVRCDMRRGTPCNNCWSQRIPCVPHRRKRKRPTEAAPPETPAPPKHAAIEPSHKHLGYNRHSDPTSNNTKFASYLGRAEYIAGPAVIDEEDAGNYSTEHGGLSTNEDQNYLSELGAFRQPQRSIRDSLITSFLDVCYPWMPVLETPTLRKAASSEPATLLLQAVFVAGSRVSLAPRTQISGDIFYRRAKAIYYLGREESPLAMVQAACLLQWWNPSGPEHISIDSSGFWLHQAVALSYQVGLHREPSTTSPDRHLRRRLWWTLVARDCIVAMCHGRPRAIHETDYDVRPLSLTDFQGHDIDSHLFIAYVDICCIAGDLAANLARGTLGRYQRMSTETRLLSWLDHLPDCVKLYTSERTLAPYNCKVRQLHILYFAILQILSPPTAQGMPSSSALLASSCMTALFDEILSHGEVPLLAPVFVFYLMIAGVTQLACFKCPSLWARSKGDMDTIKHCLLEMAKRYPSAVGAQRVIQKVSAAALSQSGSNESMPLVLQEHQRKYFEHLGPEICVYWDVISGLARSRSYDANYTSTTANQKFVPGVLNCVADLPAVQQDGSVAPSPGVGVDVPSLMPRAGQDIETRAEAFLTLAAASGSGNGCADAVESIWPHLPGAPGQWMIGDWLNDFSVESMEGSAI